MSADFFSTLMSALPTILIALLTTVLGYYAGRGMKTHEWHLQMVRERILAREALYADFLATASHYSLRAMGSKMSEPMEFTDLTQKLEHISLVGTKPVVHAAREFWDSALAAHAEKPDEAKVSAYYQRKQAFVEEAQKELAVLAKS